MTDHVKQFVLELLVENILEKETDVNIMFHVRELKQKQIVVDNFSYFQWKGYLLQDQGL